ncbi:hypothetical protein [Acinetobacter sp. Ac_5812]|uniref:hypothetical protein n=1 Tax=Acinetobacter sp. Ac_5812 TaxID=1848937 RepID=UPI00148FBDE4|nr:hypothetical protein [Acinetobacter sp. Ac_5812]NNP70456.1 hypothetical protein [Acinetobacter sp. Ac_5812]
MKNKVLKGLMFIIVWGVIYWITVSDFWFISFLVAYLIISAVDKDTLLQIVKGFDKNDETLFGSVKDLYEEVQILKGDKESLKNELQKLQNQISELKQANGDENR